VTDLFGGLLGGQTQPTQQTPPDGEIQEDEKTEEPKKESTVEDTLLSIFGGKKKTGETED
jgi:hypothetical protein